MSGTFVYSPDIRVLVNSGGTVYDLSSDIESFNVSRRSSAVSTFSAQLNNKYKKYDRRLRRMSRVVVFLKRISWMQVFAGYLDTVPYETVVPGSVSIAASCTLKRIQYTQWDPTMMESQALMPGIAGGLSLITSADKSSDGGAAKGMFNVLTEVTNWNKNHIHVQQVPQEFLAFATQLSEAIEIDPIAEQRLSELLAGNGYTGGIDPAIGNIPVNAGYGSKVSDVDIAKLAYNAGFRGEDVKWAVAVALAESGGDAGAVNNKNRDGSVDRGLWQINSVHVGSGFDVTKAFDPAYNATWAKRIHQSAGNTWKPWYAHTPRGAAYGSGPAKNHLPRATSAVATMGADTTVTPSGTSSTGAQRAGSAGAGYGLEWGLATATGQATGVVIPVAGIQTGQLTDTFGAARSGGRSHKGIDIMAPRGTPIIAAVGGRIVALNMSGNATLGGNRLWIEGDDGRFHYYAHFDTVSASEGQTVRTGQHLGTVGNTGSGAQHTPPHLHYSVNTRGRAENENSINPYRFLVSQGAETIGAGDISTMPGADGLSPFNIIWRTPQMPADLMARDRMFLNAKSVLSSIQALAKASMREFQSAPNGDFVAWFPDWFGFWGKTPLMRIEDIELIDFSMSVTDGPLATHIGVSGDRDEPGSGIHLPDWIMSKGIVTIEQKEVVRLLMALPFADNYTDFDVADFLNTFGMRPLVEEIPELRDPLWETMYALFRFMQHWTMQYRSPVQFTFMPEVYPGMRLELANHNLQVYVESVTHSGSRAGGFSTSAEVSCPVPANGRKLFNLELAE